MIQGLVEGTSDWSGFYETLTVSPDGVGDILDGHIGCTESGPCEFRGLSFSKAS